MGMGLLHFSLAGGFSSPPLVTILSDSSTNYLTSQKPRAVLHRLLETLQWVLDAMEFSLDPSKDGEEGGRAWEATIRVRFLHEGVRRSIGKRKEWKESEEVPINQLQMIATLGSFCVATIWSVERIGIRVSDEEKVAFLELWKVIGWYSGVDPMLLTTYFSDFKSASTFFLTASYHLFSPPSTSSTSTATSNPSTSSDSSDNPTLRILRAVSHQPPTYSSFFYHVQLSRLLLGNALADRLALPRVPIRARIQARLTFLTARLFVGFGQMWRKGWEEERREVTLKVLRVVVVNVFGAGRRSRFEKRERYEDKLGEGEGEMEYDAGEGGKRARELVKRYRRLVAEMVTVLGVGGAGLAILIFRLSRWLRVNRLV
ncbi:hypothetical protein BT69DRAFT_1272411 [Atractiella rhizophila]|nr:hypothetical protein BT69DRAFT_1272411 [Atractiella rhizophila]